MPNVYFTIVYVVAALAMSACAPVEETSSQGGADEQRDAQTIIQLNRDQQEALLLDKNTAPTEQITLDNYLVIAPGGRVENRSQAIAGVDSLDVNGVEFSQEQVIFYGDTAVLVGKIDIDGTMQPLGAFPPMKFMATYVRTGDGWRALSRSMTPCASIAVERGVC
ncbi:nuclear transport factor 2 family protein [Hyphococcus sp.]|uniref:nuclear transport factor 2 family protein n=1 Tax=Hyphococcus sp. TaxID=2038636 RepID=UPI003CCC22ED